MKETIVHKKFYSGWNEPVATLIITADREAIAEEMKKSLTEVSKNEPSRKKRKNKRVAD
jgi:hypothetical protein